MMWQNALIKATGEDLKEGNESKVLLTSTKPLEVDALLLLK